MQLTNWLRRVFPRMNSSRFLGARSVIRRGERELADRQRWLECLEPRMLLTTVVIDYSFDTDNFFDTQAKKDLLQTVADSLASRLEDNLLAITPGPTGFGFDNTWDAIFDHPATGLDVSITDMMVPANTIILYAGGRDLPGSTVGQGGPGGFSSSGTTEFNETVEARGQAGALLATETDFSLWGGAITFDTANAWHFGLTTDGLDSNETDFFSVAQHEIGHLLGIGTARSWRNQVSGSVFTGEESAFLFDGFVPLFGDLSHWAEGTTSDGQIATMNPVLLNGTRALFTGLDFAALTDIGWEVAPEGDGGLPSVTLSLSTEIIAEAGGTSIVTATLSEASTLDVTVDLSFDGSTATNVSDYTRSGTQIVIMAGDLTGTVTLTAEQDEDDEVSELIDVEISGLANATELEPQHVLVLIADDDSPQGVGLQLIDINPEFGIGSFPDNLVDVDGTLFFSAFDFVHLRELWKSDGTVEGTVLVADISTDPFSNPIGSSPQHLTNVNGTLFFVAADDLHGFELWKSDGTAEGTVLVKDITPGLDGNISSISELTAVGSTLYFSAIDEFGVELWESDGTPEGTGRVTDIAPDDANSLPQSLTNVNGTLFFVANDQVHGLELWKVDPITGAVSMLRDIATDVFDSGPSDLTNVDGTLFFTATDAEHSRELWKSDGTSEGTVLVRDIDPTFFPGGTVPRSSEPRGLVNFNGTLFFSADGGLIGHQLWKSDGTEEGTVLVKEVSVGFISFGPEFLTVVNDTLFFIGEDAEAGYELFISDGTTEGTELLKDIRPLSLEGNDSFAENLTNVNGRLYFTADDGTTGPALWTSDGTTAGTMLVSDVEPDEFSLGPTQLTSANGLLFFTADDGTNGRELWVLTPPGEVSPPSVTLSLSSATLAEAAGTRTVTATLSAASDLAVTIVLGFSGTATNVSDYTRSATQIVIAAGNMTGTVTLTAVQDTRDEANETIVIDITDVTNGIESGTQQVTATINDDDAPPTVTLTVNPATIGENAGQSVLTATLSAASSLDVTVALGFGGTATLTDDYTRTATQIVIAAGSMTGTATLTAVQNARHEINETVFVEITSVTNGTESGTQQVTATITDDDPVNKAPTFTKGPNQTVLEEAATSVNWATAISAGAGDVGQQVQFEVTSNTNTSLFAVPPAVSPTGVLTYTPAINATGTATITLVLRDDGGTVDGVSDTSAAMNFTITVTPVNDAPTFSKGPDQIVIEDAVGMQTVTGWATNLSRGAANEAAQALTFVVTGNTNPALFRTLPAISSPANSTTGVLTYATAANASGFADITIRLEDNGGTANGGANRSAEQTFRINVTPVNDAPTITVPAAQTTNEDTAKLIPAITVADLEATTLDVNLAVTRGQLTLGTVTGLTFQNSTTNGSATLRIQGSQTDVNNALRTLTYLPNLNVSGNDTLTATVSDLGATGTGGTLTANKTVAITIRPINDAPVRTAGMLTAINVLEDSATGAAASLGLNSLTYAAGPATATDEIAPPTPAVAQRLTFRITAIPNFVTLFKPDGTTRVNLNGLVTAAELQGLQYRTVANLFGTGDLRFSVTDNGSASLPNVNSLTETLSITVTPLNDLPTIANIADVAIDEDRSSAAIAFRIDDAEDRLTSLSALTVTATSSNIGLVPNTATNIVLGGSLGNRTILLRPLANQFGSTMITVTVTDSNLTTATDTFVLTVRPINDAPVVTIATLSVPEYTTNGFVVGTVTATDADPSDTPAFEFVPLVNNTFAIDRTTGQITVRDFTRIDFETLGVHRLTVRAIDPQNASATGIITINVQDQSFDLPAITLGDSINSVRVAREANNLVVRQGTTNLIPPTTPALPAVIAIEDIATVEINGGSAADTLLLDQTLNTAGTAASHRFKGRILFNGHNGNDVLDGRAITVGTFGVQFDGGEGNDLAQAGAEIDTLIGGAGNDMLSGGKGSDTYRFADLAADATDETDTLTELSGTVEGTADVLDFSALTTAVVVKLTSETALATHAHRIVRTSATGTTKLAPNFENGTGGAGDDAILGSTLANSLLGGAGDDTIIGGAGNDTLRGGADDDILIGGLGSDSVVGDSGNDVGLGGRGSAARGGNGAKESGDILDTASLESINEAFATFFAFEGV
ncbi:MAG: ELWxxDGT repeat protein [Planctomycetaceae bacterium]